MDKEKLLKEIAEASKKGATELVEKLTAQLDKLNEEKEDMDKRLKAFEERMEKMEKAPVTKNVAPAIVSSEKFLGYKMSDMMRTQRNKAASNPQEFPTLSNDEKAEDFAKFVIGVARWKKFNDAKGLEAINNFHQKAAMQEGTASEGGYLVPDEYMFDLIGLTRDTTFALNECTVVNMGSDTLRIPKEASLVSVAWTAEEVDATQTEPTVGELALSAKRLDGFGIVSNELMQDSAIDLPGMLSEQFAYAIARELDNQVLNGTGNPVSGVTTAAAGFSVVTSGTHPSSITADNLSDAIQKIEQGYAGEGKFVFHKQTLHYVRILKDSQNNYVWAKPGNGVPGTIWEYPYIVSTKADATTDSASPFGVFGNFKYFYIGRRLGATSLDMDPYTKFTSYQTQFRMITRWGLGVGQANAFCRLITA